MATLGNTSTSFSNFLFADGTQLNQNASPFTMPADGVITSISVCAAADSAGGGSAENAQLVVWNNSTGAVIVASSTFTLGTKSRTTSGWSFINQSVTPTFIASGTSIAIGFWRDQTSAGTTLFPIQSSSGSFKGNYQNSSSAASLTGAANWGGVNGNMGAFVTYSPGKGLWVRSGGVWNLTKGIMVRSGGVWVPATVWVRSGGVWVQTD